MLLQLLLMKRMKARKLLELPLLELPLGGIVP